MIQDQSITSETPMTPGENQGLSRNAGAEETPAQSAGDHRRDNRAAAEQSAEENHGRDGHATSKATGLATHNLTSARLLCLGLARAWLDGEDGGREIGLLKTLKTLLSRPELGTPASIAATWEMDAVWQALAPRLDAERLSFLQLLAEVLNDRARQPELDAFPAWRHCRPDHLPQAERN